MKPWVSFLPISDDTLVAAWYLRQVDNGPRHRYVAVYAHTPKNDNGTECVYVVQAWGSRHRTGVHRQKIHGHRWPLTPAGRRRATNYARRLVENQCAKGEEVAWTLSAKNPALSCAKWTVRYDSLSKPGWWLMHEGTRLNDASFTPEETRDEPRKIRIGRFTKTVA